MADRENKNEQDYGRASEARPSSEDPHVVVTDWFEAWDGITYHGRRVAPEDQANWQVRVARPEPGYENSGRWTVAFYDSAEDAEFMAAELNRYARCIVAATREADAEPNATTTRDPKPNPPDTATELLRELVEALADEESEHGFPFNFDARSKLAAARDYLSEGGV